MGDEGETVSSKPSKGAVGPVSVVWVLLIVMLGALEGIMLWMGERGGALSHVVWWAAGDLYSWRWALVLAPIVGLLTWCVPHFLFQWGTGVHLLAIIGAWLLVLGAAVLAH